MNQKNQFHEGGSRAFNCVISKVPGGSVQKRRLDEDMISFYFYYLRWLDLNFKGDRKCL